MTPSLRLPGTGSTPHLDSSLGNVLSRWNPSDREWRSKLFWSLQILGWSAATVTVVFFSWVGYFTLPDAILLAVARNLFGFGATMALCPLYRSIRLRSWTFGEYAAIAAGIFLLCGALAWLDGTFLQVVAEQTGVAQKTPMISQFLMVSTFVRWTVYLIWSLLYFIITFWMETQIRHVRAARAEAAARTSELRMLKAQVNPHFLFNALNSIQALAGDEKRVRPLIQAFADYLRFSLEQRWDIQPLGQELGALENYLHVEKTRFGEKLDYSIDAEPAARETPAPVALVQPLLENAIKYGQQSGRRLLCIRIDARLEEDSLVVTVFNTGDWISPARAGSTGLGVDSLRRRLALLYGETADLQVGPWQDGVRALVRLVPRTHALG